VSFVRYIIVIIVVDLFSRNSSPRDYNICIILSTATLSTNLIGRGRKYNAHFLFYLRHNIKKYIIIMCIICIGVCWVRSVYQCQQQCYVRVSVRQFRPFDSRGMRTKELLPYNNIILYYCILYKYRRSLVKSFKTYFVWLLHCHRKKSFSRSGNSEQSRRRVLGYETYTMI